MANCSVQYSLPGYPRYYLVDDAEVHVVASGGPQDRAILGLYPDRALVLFEGDCTPEPVYTRIRDLAAAGSLPTIKNVLLDFTQFTGMIDWEFAKSRDKRAWGNLCPEKCAYVMRDKAAVMIAKGLVAFVVETECGIFLSHAEAFRWLGWDEREFDADDFASASAAS